MEYFDKESLIKETNEKQFNASNPKASIWTSANAGSGKTKVLIDRIARLLLAGTEPQKILSVTYTRAAAAEMTSRLFETLGKWTVSTDDELTAKLKALDPEFHIGIDGLQKARALFARALETPGGLKIDTIHAFCTSILKRFPLEAGVSPGFEVIDEHGAEILKEEAYDIAASIEPDLFLEITDNVSSPINLLNSANKYLPFDKANLDSALEKTIGEKSGQDLDELLNAASEVLAIDDLCEIAAIMAESDKSTDTKNAKIILESLALTPSARSLELAKSFGFYASGEKKNTIKSAPPTKALYKNPAIFRMFGDYDKDNLGGIWKTFIDKIIIYNNAKIANDTHDYLYAASLFNGEYLKLKESKGLLDYDDLLKFTSRLLNGDNSANLWVLYKLDGGLSHVLIDESQDTSAEQWDLLEPLLSALETENNDKFPRTRFIVGDEKQSIYRFQGASPERYLTEKEKFKSHNRPSENRIFDEVNFEVSFRTGQTILDGVDAVWTQLNGFDFNREFNDGLETKFLAPRNHISSRIGENSQIELWPITEGIDETELEPDAWKHPKNSILPNSPKNLLAERIARELKARIGRDLIYEKGKKRILEAKDIMILIRTRTELYDLIIRKLKQYGIKTAGADSIKLKDNIAVLDLLAIASFSLRKENDFNLACVLKGGFCGLLDDDKFLLPIAYNRKGKSLWQQLQTAMKPESEIYSHLNPDEFNQVKSAFDFLSFINQKSGSLAPFEFFALCLEYKFENVQTGYQKFISRFGKEAIEPIDILLDNAIKAASFGTPNLQNFINIIENSNTTVKREFDNNEEGVKIMTIHASKGREAPMVILPETTSNSGRNERSFIYDDKNQCPIMLIDFLYLPQRLNEIKEEAAKENKKEHNRLLYVAMTRAKDRLIICGHKHRDIGKSWYANTEVALGNLLNSRDAMLEDGTQYRLWGADFGDIDIISQVKAAKEEIIIPNWVHSMPNEETFIQRIAPTSLEDDNAKAMSPVYSPLMGGRKAINNQRYLRGRLIHEMLEKLPNINSETREKWAIDRLKSETSLSEDDKFNIISESFKILNHKDYSEFFSKNSRAEVAIIGSAAKLPQNMIINGIIDRLVITETEVLILDFKTNRPPPQTIDNVEKSYINQMAAYYALLSETYKNKKIRCALLWTDIPLFMEIPNDILDIALAKLCAIKSSI